MLSVYHCKRLGENEMTEEHTIKPATVERRIALDKRRRVAEMSQDEMRRELLTSEVTGLPNRRAFDETGLAPAVAMSDVDGLKALNKFGYEVGDAFLRAKAEALREAGLDAYHDKGDEFLCLGNTINELKCGLERARALLKDRTVDVPQADGGSLSFIGADFSYGVGTDINEAERRLQQHKAEREARGELARGELRGIVVTKRKLNDSSSESSTSAV
jgi:GGDEF domain-containing protein